MPTDGARMLPAVKDWSVVGMSVRASRLLRLLELLRSRQRPATGAWLAQTLQVSVRTLYRDIDTLRAQGAHIDGDRGVGFQLRAGFLLPPMMFSENELEALVLGARWVQGQADAELAQAADAALRRIAGILPERLRLQVDTSGLLVPQWRENKTAEPWLPVLRHAIRDEHVVQMDYADTNGNLSSRLIWPFAMAFFDPVTRLIAAWCELRGDFRHFRADRVSALHDTGTCYPERRHALIKRWRQHECERRNAATDRN